MIVSRYAPYHFFPNARYSIGVFRQADSVRVTAMRNPWLTFDSIHLGRVFARYGGGGHQRAVPVVLSGENRKYTEGIADELLCNMRHEETHSGLREAVVA